MMRSTDRFLTTHAGSLPRPDDLVRIMYAKEEGQAVERAALASHVRNAVAGVVARQKGAGVDIINDGEMSKPSYATYVKDRLSGFGGTGNTFVYQDLAASQTWQSASLAIRGDPGGRLRLATGRSHSAILRRSTSTSRILQPPSAPVSGGRRSYPRRPLA
jgi:5-methyltetrahydropteroyltriglutamate--homocysteine methyltransferase